VPGGGGGGSSSSLDQGPLFSMNFYDCNTYYDSLMIGNVFILMFAFEIKFCLYNPSGFDPSAQLIAQG